MKSIIFLTSILVSLSSFAGSNFIQETECEIDGRIYSFIGQTVTEKTSAGDFTVRTAMTEIQMVVPETYMDGVTEWSSYSYFFMKTGVLVVIPKLTKKYIGPLKVHHSEYKTIVCKAFVLYPLY